MKSVLTAAMLGNFHGTLEDVPMTLPPAIITKALGRNVANRGSSQPISHHFGIS